MRSADLCANVPEAYRAQAAELVEQLDFLTRKLEASRAMLEDMPLVFMAKNSQGSQVPKRNPAFEEYAQLMRTFLKALSELRDILGKQAAAQPKMLKFEKYAKTIKALDA